MLKKVDKNEKIISLMMPSIADLKNPKFKINMSRAERRRQIKFERKIYNKAPSMIHEKKYVPMNCVMCDVKMKSIHDTHNPYPITELCYSKEAHLTDNPNRCCSECNEIVTEARLEMSKKLNPQIVGKAYFMNKENKIGVAA